MPSTGRIVVAGLIAQYPLGGTAWDYAQYLIGLKRLGHDVYYLEDTGRWPYHPDSDGTASLALGAEFSVAFLAQLMAQVGLDDRWAYRVPVDRTSWRWAGMSDAAREEVLSSADLLLNVGGGLQDPASLLPTARRVYIDIDPVFTQVKLALGHAELAQRVAAHARHFSYAEALDVAPVPRTAYHFRGTRKPIVLDLWNPSGAAPERDVFTTGMNWSVERALEHQGVSYGQKDVELSRYLDLPTRVAPLTLELALASGKVRHSPVELLRHRGFRVVHPNDVCRTPDDYRRYIVASRGEWSVAKQGYVVGRAGWFSGRTACYLAAGRPAVVQQTGLDAALTGARRGLLTFETPDEAAAALAEVQRDYAAHARTARELAAAHFDATRVLSLLLERAMAA